MIAATLEPFGNWIRELAGSRQGLGAKTPEDEHRGGDDCDADKKETKRHNAFLPWLPTMA